MTEKYDSGDDLDFYDFLENVAEKFDSITNQSIAERVEFSFWKMLIIFA
jgi:hypothetical protein